MKSLMFYKSVIIVPFIFSFTISHSMQGIKTVMSRALNNSSKIKQSVLKSVKKNNLYSKTRLATHKSKIAAVSLTAGATGYAAYKKYANKPAHVCAGVTLDPYLKMHQELAQEIESNTVQEQKIKNDAHAFAQKFLSEGVSPSVLEVLKIPSFWKNKVWVSTLLKENLIRTKILDLIKNNSEQLFDANNCAAIITALCQARLTKEEYNQYLHDAIIKVAPYLLKSDIDWLSPFDSVSSITGIMSYPPFSWIANQKNKECTQILLDIFYYGLDVIIKNDKLAEISQAIKKLDKLYQIIHKERLESDCLLKYSKLLNAFSHKIYEICTEYDYIEPHEEMGHFFEALNDITNTFATSERSLQKIREKPDLMRIINAWYHYRSRYTMRILEAIENDNNETFTKKFLLQFPDEKNLISTYGYCSIAPIVSSFYTAWQKEKELEKQNYYVFYHGQSSHLLFVEQLATHLYLLKNGIIAPEFLLLHIREEMKMEQEKMLHENILSNDQNFNRRPYVLFFNNALFANAKNPGSHTPQYLAGNFNQNMRIIDLSKIFERNGLESLYDKYRNEIIELINESKAAYTCGNLIQVAIPKNKIQSAFYLSSSGGPKRKAQIVEIVDQQPKIYETADVGNILYCYHSNPKLITKIPTRREMFFADKDVIFSNRFEFCAAMTYDERGLLNPKSGAKMYVYPSGDQQKIAAFEHKRKELFERIAQDIKHIQQPK